TRASAEDHDATLLHVTLGAQRDVGLGDLRHRDRRLHTRRCSCLLEEILQCEGVHDGSKHAHVVGTSAHHPALTEFGSAEEVTTADDDCDLDAVYRLGDLAGDLTDHVGIDSDLPASEG